jgi:hypothetical protein
MNLNTTDGNTGPTERSSASTELCNVPGGIKKIWFLKFSIIVITTTF